MNGTHVHTNSLGHLASTATKHDSTQRSGLSPISGKSNARGIEKKNGRKRSPQSSPEEASEAFTKRRKRSPSKK